VVPNWNKQAGKSFGSCSKLVPLSGYTANSQVPAWNVGNKIEGLPK
jgi:hypothetical protein